MGQSWRRRYRFPKQGTTLCVGDQPWDEHNASFGSVVAIDRIAGELEVKIGKGSWWDRGHPGWLFPWKHHEPRPKPRAPLRLAQVWANGTLDDGWAAARALLLRAPPRLSDGVPRRIEGERGQALAKRVAGSSGARGAGPAGHGPDAHRCGDDRGVGRRGAPPRGDGAEPLGDPEPARQGARASGRSRGASVREGRAAQRRRDRHPRDHRECEVCDSLAARGAGDRRHPAAVGARPELAGAVDVLFVDEAGELALAGVLAVADAAGRGLGSMALLGDPQQLEEPRTAKHPRGRTGPPARG